MMEPCLEKDGDGEEEFAERWQRTKRKGKRMKHSEIQCLEIKKSHDYLPKYLITCYFSFSSLNYMGDLM